MRVGWFVAVSTALLLVFPGASPAQSAAVLAALARDDCEAVLDGLNRGLADGEAGAYGLAGQMYQSGVCLRKDASQAAALYGQAAVRGDAASARSLALLHAHGDGVPQSYSAAGYWFAVMRGERPGTVAPSVDGYETPDAIARTYVEAVHGFAEHALAYPDEAAVRGVRGSVTMRFDPRIGIATVVGSSDNKRSFDLGPGRLRFEHAALAGYQSAIRALPRPDLPQNTDYASDRTVRFDRDRSPGGRSLGVDGIQRSSDTDHIRSEPSRQPLSGRM